MSDQQAQELTRRSRHEAAKACADWISERMRRLNVRVNFKITEGRAVATLPDGTRETWEGP